jgi:hypothetical protein
VICKMTVSGAKVGFEHTCEQALLALFLVHA